MTEIKVFKKGEVYTKITCDGHTGYGVFGEDVVCASVSSIVQTAALGMLAVAGANVIVKRDKKNAIFEIIIPNDLSQSCAHDVQTIFATMMCGLSDLYSQYSDFIEMEVQDVL